MLSPVHASERDRMPDTHRRKGVTTTESETGGMQLQAERVKASGEKEQISSKEKDSDKNPNNYYKLILAWRIPVTWGSSPGRGGAGLENQGLEQTLSGGRY